MYPAVMDLDEIKNIDCLSLLLEQALLKWKLHFHSLLSKFSVSYELTQRESSDSQKAVLTGEATLRHSDFS